MIYYLMVLSFLSAVFGQLSFPYGSSSNGHQIIRSSYRNIDINFDKDTSTSRQDQDEQSQINQNKNFLLNNKPIYVQIVPQSLHQRQQNGKQDNQVNFLLQGHDSYLPQSNRQNSDIIEESRNGNGNNIKRIDTENGNLPRNSHTNNGDFREDKHIYVHLLAQNPQQNLNPPPVNTFPENGLTPSLINPNYANQIQTIPPAIPVFPILPQGNKVFILAKNPIDGNNQNPTNKYNVYGQ